MSPKLTHSLCELQSKVSFASNLLTRSLARALPYSPGRRTSARTARMWLTGEQGVYRNNMLVRSFGVNIMSIVS